MKCTIWMRRERIQLLINLWTDVYVGWVRRLGTRRTQHVCHTCTTREGGHNSLYHRPPPHHSIMMMGDDVETLPEIYTRLRQVYSVVFARLPPSRCLLTMRASSSPPIEYTSSLFLLWWTPPPLHTLRSTSHIFSTCCKLWFFFPVRMISPLLYILRKESPVPDLRATCQCCKSRLSPLVLGTK